ncbi:MAG TPA: PqqD family protein [Actinomycetota bacterium]|jgi:hypothetical protein
MRLLIPKDVIFEEVDHQVVLLSLAGGRYYKLNGSGTRVWALIQEHGDLEAVQEAMVTEYAADPAEVRRDVAALVDDLRAHGLVEVDDA